MPSLKEITVEQKRRLYQLLAIQKHVKEEPEILKDFISQTISEMDKEDVAYIEKQIEVRYGK